MKRALLLGLCLVAALGFAALGLWQVERRAWKLDLIARVEARVHAPPAAAPSNFEPRRDEYRRVRLSGVFRHDKATLVDALTERGPGFWVVTPLETTNGAVLVNRGFVPPEHRSDYARPSGAVALTGLLRLTEQNGRFLRPNQPEADKWYSRDVVAMAARRKVGPVAPFFVDVDATRGYPVGGLTVVQFRNAHLAYALTWFALAALCAYGMWRIVRERR